MFSTESDTAYLGKILKKLATGKTLKNLLLELTWEERAKLLVKLKQVKRCHADFINIMAQEE